MWAVLYNNNTFMTPKERASQVGGQGTIPTLSRYCTAFVEQKFDYSYLLIALPIWAAAPDSFALQLARNTLVALQIVHGGVVGREASKRTVENLCGEACRENLV